MNSAIDMIQKTYHLSESLSISCVPEKASRAWTDKAISKFHDRLFQVMF